LLSSIRIPYQSETRVNTTQLECFVQVAQNLSFRRAAEELHLSQPTISKQVASLEDELGGTLFIRTTREVALTALGESFLRDAREILRMTYAASERARHLACGHALTLGYSDACELMRLAPVLDRLRREHEGLHVTFNQGPRDANVAMLMREQLDVVMGFESAALTGGGIAFTGLLEDVLSCVVRVDSPLAELDQIGPEDVEGLPQVLCVSEGLRRRGYRAQASIPGPTGTTVTRCATSSEAYTLVDAGFGYALVPSLYTMPDPLHKILRWRGSPSMRYGFYHRSSSNDGLMPRFARIATETYGRPGFERPLPESWQP
jgi:DNA-binding transcriptional LysR family regulator